MKALLTLAAMLVFAVSFGTANAVEPTVPMSPLVQADLVADGDYSPAIDCGAFDCPISGTRVFTQYYNVDNCGEIGDDRIEAAAKQLTSRICARFKECCVANGCDEGSCRMVGFRSDCITKTRLCISVKVEFKCE